MLSVIQLFLFFSCHFNKIYIILLQLAAIILNIRFTHLTLNQPKTNNYENCPIKFLSVYLVKKQPSFWATEGIFVKAISADSL